VVLAQIYLEKKEYEEAEEMLRLAAATVLIAFGKLVRPSHPPPHPFLPVKN
jgi:hypothetical protein